MIKSFIQMDPDVKSITNAFNGYFSEVGCNYADKVPTMNTKISNFDSLTSKLVVTLFFVSPKTAEEIKLRKRLPN